MTKIPSWLLSRRALPIAIIVAAILRLCAYPLAKEVADTPLEYEIIARHLVTYGNYAFIWFGPGGPAYFETTAFMPPGQVYLTLGPIWLLGHHAHLGMLAIEALLAVLFVVVMFHLIHRITRDVATAMLAAWLATLYPLFILSAVSFGVVAAVLLLNATLLLIIAAYFKRIADGQKTWKLAILLGAAMGVLTFFRAEAYGTMTLTVIILAWKFRTQLARHKTDLILAAAAALVVVSPWIIRNYVTFDRLIIGSSSGVFNFWRGNHPGATGSAFEPNGTPVWTTNDMRAEIHRRLTDSSQTEFVSNNYHKELALNYIRNHPGETIARDFKKLAMVIGVDWYDPRARNPLYILIYAATVALAIIGIRELRTNPVVASANRTLELRSLEFRAVLTVIATWVAADLAITAIFFALSRMQVFLIGIYFPVVVFGARRVLQRIGVWPMLASPSDRTATTL